MGMESNFCNNAFLIHKPGLRTGLLSGCEGLSDFFGRGRKSGLGAVGSKRSYFTDFP